MFLNNLYLLGPSDRKGHQGSRHPPSHQQQARSPQQQPAFVPEGHQPWEVKGKKKDRTGSIYNENFSPENSMPGGGQNSDSKSIGEVGK